MISQKEKLSAYIVCCMILTYVMGLGVLISGIQIYLFPLVALVLLFVLQLPHGRIVSRDFCSLQGVIIVIFLVGVGSSIINDTITINYAIKMTILLVLPIMLKTTIRNKELYKLILFVMCVAVAISCFVAILQSLKVQWALDIWYNRFYNSANIRSGYLNNSLLNGRSSGLSSYSLNLAFQILEVFTISLYYCKKNANQKKLYRVGPLVTIVLFVGAVASGTRTAVLLCICSVLIIYRREIRNNLTRNKIIGMFIVGTIFVVSYIAFFRKIDFILFFLNRFKSISNVDSSIRSQTAKYYLDTLFSGKILNIFLGFGFNSMELHKGSNLLGSGHNCLVNMVFEFGIIGLTAGILLYTKVYGLLRRTISSSLSRYIIVSLAMYLLMSLTNDSNLLDADLFHIIYLSVIVGYVENARLDDSYVN